MSQLLERIKNSPLLVRVVPFALFVTLTFFQDFTGVTGRYWIYTLKTFLGVWMIWVVRPFIAEMRWKLSWEAVVTGVVVFVMWVGLDPLLEMVGIKGSYPKMKMGEGGWEPHLVFSAGMAWFFNIVRLLGSTFVVPPLEEVFFRSFIYRYAKKVDFLSVPLGQFFLGPFLIASVFFGFGHREWLAGILCGFAYQGLVIWKNRLDDAITAHAITNALLGGYVIWRGAWQFW